jgi:hypothetical protein
MINLEETKYLDFNYYLGTCGDQLNICQHFKEYFGSWNQTGSWHNAVGLSKILIHTFISMKYVNSNNTI